MFGSWCQQVLVEVFVLARFEAQAIARVSPAPGVAEIGAQGAVEAVLEAQTIIAREVLVALENACCA